MSKTVKVLVSVLAAIGLLAGARRACSDAHSSTGRQKKRPGRAGGVLTDKIEQLQDKIDELRKKTSAKAIQAPAWRWMIWPTR